MTTFLQQKSLKENNGINQMPIASSEGDMSLSVNLVNGASLQFGGPSAQAPTADSIDHGVTEAPYERRFSPYDFNGGTTLAISGADFCVIAAD
jgi:hypothetical protein